MRPEIRHQLNDMRANTYESREAEARAQADARMQAISMSANVKDALRKGLIKCRSRIAPAPHGVLSFRLRRR
ncbi:MAG: hypothetical protein WCC39_11230 [Telluria sp.]